MRWATIRGVEPRLRRPDFSDFQEFHLSIPATQMRPGMVIKFKDDLHLVFSVEHRTPGNLRAFIQAKLRNIRTGSMFVERFRSPDPIDRVIVDEIKMEFLYND